VTVAQVEDEDPTVLEIELLPGDGALLAPEWVPWAERLAEYRAHQVELAEAAAADGGEADADGGVDDADGEDEDDDLDDDDDDDDDRAADILHAGDLDGVDIDELDESSDEDADALDQDAGDIDEEE
jgi:hypothetical protein